MTNYVFIFLQFGGSKKPAAASNVDDLISEELHDKGVPNAAKKPMLGAKPKFAMKPGMKSSGAPLQTPQKEFGERNASSNGRAAEN